MCQLPLCELKEIVGLFFPNVSSLKEEVTFIGIRADAGIVSCSHSFDPEPPRILKESVELQESIAESAGNGCSALQITRDERADDGLLEVVLQIDQVVGKTESIRNPASVVHVLE
jgi:hypothetical protein